MWHSVAFCCSWPAPPDRGRPCKPERRGPRAPARVLLIARDGPQVTAAQCLVTKARECHDRGNACCHKVVPNRPVVSSDSNSLLQTALTLCDLAALAKTVSSERMAKPSTRQIGCRKLMRTLTARWRILADVAIGECTRKGRQSPSFVDARRPFFRTSSSSKSRGPYERPHGSRWPARRAHQRCRLRLPSAPSLPCRLYRPRRADCGNRPVGP